MVGKILSPWDLQAKSWNERSCGQKGRFRFSLFALGRSLRRWKRSKGRGATRWREDSGFRQRANGVFLANSGTPDTPSPSPNLGWILAQSRKRALGRATRYRVISREVSRRGIRRTGSYPEKIAISRQSSAISFQPSADGPDSRAAAAPQLTLRIPG